MMSQADKNETRNRLKLRYLSLIVILNLGIFTLNNLLESPGLVSALYVAVMFASLFQPGRRITIATGLLSTCLVISESLIRTGQENPLPVIEAISVIAGIWVAAFFILRFKRWQIEEFKNRERLKALFTYATEGMLICDHKGNIIMVNPNAEQMFGYEPNELVGQKIEVLIPERVTQRHVKHREKYNASPKPRPMGVGQSLHGQKKDGSEFPVEISLSHFSTTEGIYVISFIIDITERQLAEQAIRKEKEVAQMYLDIAPVIFLVLDTKGNISLINQSGCRILGYSENELIGKNWMELFLLEDDRPAAHDRFHKLINNLEQFPPVFENNIYTREGNKLTISWRYTIIRDEKGNPVAVLNAGQDISERKKQQELIERTNKELNTLNEQLEDRVANRTQQLDEAVRKLEASRQELSVALEKEKQLGELKSRFVTMASHEFRTPLSTILSSVTLISKYNEPEQEEKRLKHIQRIKNSVGNLTSILNDFLSLGKLEEGKIGCSPTSFSITSFSGDIINELREITKKGQEIHYEHKGPDADVYLDKNLTRNICLNLLSNAIKYSEEGKQIRFSTSINNEKLVIGIEDQGMGIPESEQEHLFERFFRAGNASNIQGTGLGLNIVKKYTELMNGDVSFRSELNKGSIFTVELPVKLEPVNDA